MHDFFNVILKSAATIISSVVLLFTGTPSPVAQQPTQPASVVVAVAPITQELAVSVAATEEAPVLQPASKNDVARTSIIVSQPAAVVAAPITISGVSQNYVDDQIQILRNSLSSEIFKYSSTQFPHSPGISQYTANLAISQRIDQLTGTRLSNITVSGVSGLTAADIPTDITASNYLPLTGGALTSTLTVAGNVGIGTTSPWGLLSVNANGLASGAPQFVVGSSTRPNFIVANNGSVGIGTTTPTAPIDVVAPAVTGREGVAHFGVSDAGTDSLYIANNSTIDAVFLPQILSSRTSSSQTGLAIVGQTDSANDTGTNPLVRFDARQFSGSPLSGTYSTITTRPLFQWTNNAATMLMTIAANGNVGIGTTTPWGLLSVNANGLSSSSPQFVVGSSTQTNFIVANNGNVGIGTTTPGKLLTLAGTTAVAQAIYYSDSTSFGQLGFYQAGTVFGTINQIGSAFSDSTRAGNLEITESANNPSGSIDLRTNSTSRLRVTGTGNVGIGTTSPYANLTVWGANTSASTKSFVVANSASTTLFAVSNDGNATLSGTLTQGSDRRLKENITPLGDSYGLAAMAQLNPVSYGRIDQPGSGVQLGFIAQEVQPILPELVSTSSATALTPDGTLTLNYINIIPAIVKAIQELASKIGTSAHLVIDTLTARDVQAQRMCLGSTCITETQLKSILDNVGAAVGSNTNGSASSTPDTTAPAITVNGANPAHLQIGDTYSDLGAVVTDDVDQIIGVHASVGSTPIEQAFIDTRTATTYHIDYVATDAAGNTATSTRTVIVEAGE